MTTTALCGLAANRTRGLPAESFRHVDLECLGPEC
jgi:hypothetical protein